MGDVKEQCDDIKKDVPSSSSSKDLSKSLPEDAFNNFLQGKRHMLVQDYSFAVQSLATACELYVQHFGELAIECAEVYFLYGKALFRLSQKHAGVLGGALNDDSNEEEENSSESESKENESEKNSEEEGGEENNETEETDKEEKEPSESTDSPPAVIDETSSEAKAKEENSKPAESANAPKEESAESKAAGDNVTSSDENKTEEKADENQETDDDLELAWDNLETAKTIFQRQGTVESELKCAEILQLLAEISMESDRNASAIEDLKTCLEIQKKHLKSDDRLLAETYYQMGLVLLLDKMYYEALDNFRTTKHILELCLENVKNKPIDESAGSFASADKEVEITDLENILLDIQEKIEDTEELIRDAKKELEDAFAVLGAGIPAIVKDKGESSSSSTGSKPVSNITHLVKRKKPDEKTTESDPKRIKLTSSVPNGETKVTPPENITKAEG